MDMPTNIFEQSAFEQCDTPYKMSSRNIPRIKFGESDFRGIHLLPQPHPPHPHAHTNTHTFSQVPAWMSCLFRDPYAYAFGKIEFVLNLGSQKKARNTFQVCQKMLWQVSNKKIKFPGVKNAEKLSKKRISYLLPFRPTFKTAKNFFFTVLGLRKTEPTSKIGNRFSRSLTSKFFSALQTNLKLKNGSAWAQ